MLLEKEEADKPKIHSGFSKLFENADKLLFDNKDVVGKDNRTNQDEEEVGSIALRLHRLILPWRCPQSLKVELMGSL